MLNICAKGHLSPVHTTRIHGPCNLLIRKEAFKLNIIGVLTRFKSDF